MKPYKAVLIIVAIVLLDQVIKFWVKTHMFLDQEIVVTHWFRIHFAENSGMAFSMTMPGIWGKISLSLFRVVAVIAGIWFIARLFRQKAHWGFIVCCSVILAGAIGNLIDGMFYGLIFSDSNRKVATLFPASGGYAGFLHGQVVDMLRFPIYQGFFPTWLPVWGGQSFEFFNAVFNVADSAITTGVIAILIFQHVFFPENNTRPEETQTSQ